MDLKVFISLRSLRNFFSSKGLCLKVCYRLVNFFPKLISHSFVGVCFCFKIASFILIDLVFSSFDFLFRLAASPLCVNYF